MFVIGSACVLLLGASAALLLWNWRQDRRDDAKAKAPALVQAPAPAAPLVFVRSWRPTTAEEWQKAFAGWSDSDPRWRCLWDLLSFQLEAELGEMQGVAPNPDAIVQLSGRVQMLLFLRSQILHLRGKPDV